MSKGFIFFIFLVEQYSFYENKSANDILNLWDKLNITNIIYEMYPYYHIEDLNNAFNDIYKLIKEKISIDRY